MQLYVFEDKRFLIDSAVEPKNKMRIIDGSTNYSVQNVEIVGPGGAHILYKVQARI